MRDIERAVRLLSELQEEYGNKIDKLNGNQHYDLAEDKQKDLEYIKAAIEEYDRKAMYFEQGYQLKWEKRGNE